MQGAYNSLEHTVCSLKSSQGDLSNITLNLPSLPKPIFEISYRTESDKDETVSTPNPTFSADTFNAKVIKAIPLTSGEDVKTVIDLSLDLSASCIEFQPGDSLSIVPINSLSEVEQILHHLRLVSDADRTYKLKIKDGITVKNPSSIAHIPMSGTIRHILQSCLEIRAVPKKLFVRVLAEYATDPADKRRLEELCSRQGAKEYGQFITEARTTLLDIFETFPSCSPPIERVFEFLPRLQARPYSIASSPLSGPEVHVVFSLLELPPKSQKGKKYGVCTGWLYLFADINKTLIQNFDGLSLTCDKSNAPTVPLFLRKSSGFHLPQDLSVPLILIGPGTGISPFISFLQHRGQQKDSMPKEQIFGEIWLFIGCRYYERDYLFKSTVHDFLESGVISRLFESFSRDKPSLKDEGVRYVQDNIKRHSKEFVCQLLEKNSIVYVCGDGKNMATGVMEAIVSSIKMETIVSEKEAQELVCQLKKDGRYLEDIWV